MKEKVGKKTAQQNMLGCKSAVEKAKRGTIAGREALSRGKHLISKVWPKRGPTGRFHPKKA